MSFLFSNAPSAYGALVLSAVGLSVACIIDLRARRIPNRLNLVLAIGLITLHLSGGGSAGLIDGLLAAAICFVVGILLYAIGALGAGDVKLIAAISLALTPGESLQLLARVALAGGILGIARLIADGNFGNALFGLLSRARRRAAERSSVPYAIAISAGWLWLVAARWGWSV